MKKLLNIANPIFVKIIPLILLYLCLVALFIENLNYEAIITLTAGIPLLVYIFNKDLKIELILRWVLYVIGVGVIIYITQLFSSGYHWSLFCQRYSDWCASRWEGFFYQDLKYLIYLGVIFLAVRNKKYGNN